MILKFNELCEINFDISYVNILEFENRKLFSNMINALYLLCDGQEADEKIVLFEKTKIYDLSKDCNLCFDIFSMDYENRKITSAVNKYIFNAVNSEYDKKIAIENKLRELVEILREFIYDLDFDLDFNNNVTVEDFIKILAIKVDAEVLDNPFVKIKTFIDIVSSLKLYEVIVFANVRSYFSDPELEELYKYIMMRGQKILFAEPFVNEKILNYEYKTIIDKDCFVYKKH